MRGRTCRIEDPLRNLFLGFTIPVSGNSYVTAVSTPCCVTPVICAPHFGSPTLPQNPQAQPFCSVRTLPRSFPVRIVRGSVWRSAWRGRCFFDLMTRGSSHPLDRCFLFFPSLFPAVES